MGCISNTKKIAIAAFGICSVMAVSSICAYFTDSDKATNIFQVGQLSIELQEPEWDPDNTPTDMTPNQSVKKDPQIKNTGSVSSYVFAKVAMPKTSYILVNDDGTKAETSAKVHELFYVKSGTGSYGPLLTAYNSTDWTVLPKYTDTTSSSEYNYYVFAYNTPIKAGATTSKLFTEVKIQNSTEGFIEDKTYSIVINAAAIQSENLAISQPKSLEAIYGTYLNQA
jgi:hypothetical protein